MKIGNHIKQLILWVMLTAVAVAYTGKALHTHTESYYDSLRTTRSAAANGMSDNCPICHFNLLFFLFDNFQSFTFYTTLLTAIIVVQPVLHLQNVVRFFSLRAPPALL
jgi:hypothetical protein